MKQLIIILLVLTVFQASAQKKKKSQPIFTPVFDTATVVWRHVEVITDTVYKTEYRRIMYEQDGLAHIGYAQITSRGIKGSASSFEPVTILINSGENTPYDKWLPIEKLIQIF